MVVEGSSWGPGRVGRLVGHALGFASEQVAASDEAAVTALRDISQDPGELSDAAGFISAATPQDGWYEHRAKAVKLLMQAGADRDRVAARAASRRIARATGDAGR